VAVVSVRYTAFYCEENIWHLANDGMVSSVIFIANPQQQVACFAQRQAEQPSWPTLWDYHVVAAEGRSDVMIWDLDSALPCPCPAAEYFAATFPVLPARFQRFAPWFRICSSSDFLQNFSSDRRHMRAPDGTWQKAPPPWPCIGSNLANPHSLDQFTDFSTSRTIGTVVEGLHFPKLLAALTQ
jgi:protein N-terminal glutamine amidohydrolase